MTPFRTTAGDPINVAFAAGKDVTVNAIVGLPYIRSTGSILAFNDNIVIQAKVGQAHLPIEYRVPHCRNPSELSPPSLNTDKRYKGICKELQVVEDQVLLCGHNTSTSDSVTGATTIARTDASVYKDFKGGFGQTPISETKEAQMAAFQLSQAHLPQIAQPYAGAVSRINDVGSNEWRIEVA